MKTLLIFLGLILSMRSYSQVQIHAHNDYEKPRPLFNALENKADYIEADVFLQNSGLLVAHSKTQVMKEKTLEALYIKPIVSLYRKFKSKVSEDTSYRFSLMIDIKEGGDKAIRQLIKAVKPYQRYFDRKLNSNAVQLVITGDRGNIADWSKYPRYIFFDGRPFEKYDDATVKRLALVSDSYTPYSENKDKMKAVLDQVHQWGKSIRFWGTPDNEFSWNYFIQSGVDIINTDKPEVCRKFIDARIKE